jgi:hypothetical protein
MRFILFDHSVRVWANAEHDGGALRIQAGEFQPANPLLTAKITGQT